jgi:sugar transferase (PEP-CTERM/EpsH1 system associated)
MTSGSPPLVLHVIHHLVIGGMENGLVNLIQHMSERTFRHAVICIEDYSEFRDRIRRPDVRVIALHRSRIGVWRVRREIVRLCRELCPNIVHTRNMSGLDALLPARMAGVRRCVHGEHGWDVTDLRGESRKKILLRRLHSPLVDRYVTVSRDIRRYLVERVGIAQGRIQQIYNGVDTSLFAPAPGERIRTVVPLTFAGPDQLVIGTVGRAQAVKDQATLLRAFAELLQRRPGLRDRMRLALVGSGPKLGELKELAGTLGIAELTWIPGALPNVPDVLRDLDVFVLPSLNEGISNTILEAMASGLPVLATAVGGNVEIVEDGIGGRLFGAGDVAQLARLIEDYLEQPDLRHSHGAAARRVAVGRFALSGMVENYRALYASMLGEDVKRIALADAARGGAMADREGPAP